MTSFSQLVRDGALKFSDGYRTKKDELSTSGYRVLRVADVEAGRIKSEGTDYVDASFAKQIGEKVAREHDILLTTKGTIGRVAVVPGLNGEQLVYSPQLCYFRVTDFAVLNRRFLRYWFSSPEASRQIQMYSGSTDMAPYLSLADIKRLTISLPPMGQQAEIGEVLGALDDKIAANRSVAERASRLQHELWRQGVAEAPTVRLLNHTAARLGGTPPRSDKEAWGGSIAWASVRDMSTAPEGVIVSTAETISEEASSSAKRLQPLPAGSTFLSARGTVGVVTTNAIPCAINQSAYAFVPPLGHRVALRLGVESLVDSLRAKAHGSVFSTITRETLSEAEVPDPHAPGMEFLSHGLEQLEDRRVAAIRENVTLARTRDELLPLLMNGTITVKDAEARVEEEV